MSLPDPGVPTRMCAGCRGRSPKPSLVRIGAVGGTLVVDRRQRLPGRGAYLHPAYACWQAAVRRRAVERGLRLRPGPLSVLDLPGAPEPGTA